LVTVHAGTSRYEKLNLMNDLIGGAFTRHPDPCEVRIEPRNGHPLTAGVSAFTVKDEHYFMQMDAKDADVFLHSHSVHGVQPAGWSRAVGAGRICVLTPGHNLEVWLHPEFRKLLANALRWAAKVN
jgi:type 1 glutamine amidotransferase